MSVEFSFEQSNLTNNGFFCNTLEKRTSLGGGGRGVHSVKLFSMLSQTYFHLKKVFYRCHTTCVPVLVNCFSTHRKF